MQILRQSLRLMSACLVGLATATTADETHTMTGCLAKGAEAGTFLLTDVEAVDSVAIAAAPEGTGNHVGHKVEITGVTIKGPDPAVHTMEVSGMKHLAASCP